MMGLNISVFYFSLEVNGWYCYYNNIQYKREIECICGIFNEIYIDKMKYNENVKLYEKFYIIKLF